jgi:N-acetylmuramoyl-L-alanine amidase
MRNPVRFIVCGVVLAQFASTVCAASLTEPRIGKLAAISRMVLDLPEGARFEIEPMGAALRVTLPGQSFNAKIKKFKQPELSGFTLENGNGDAILTLVTPQGVSSRSGYRQSLLGASEGKTGSRLVLDFSGAYADVTPLKPTGVFAFQKAIGTRFTAVIDPGHGGKDPGARGVLTEEPLNLEVAKRVTAQLQAAGVEVQMTRTNAGTPSSDKAMDLASRAAQGRNKSVFVSIHANARPAKKANTNFGTEVYFFSPSKTPTTFPAPSIPEPLQSLEAKTSLFKPGEFKPAESIGYGIEKLGEALQALDGSPSPARPTPNGQGPTEINPTRDEPRLTNEPATPSDPGLATSDTDQLAYLPLEPSKLANSPERSLASQQLATSVLSNILGTTAGFNGGTRNADYYVIKESECPAILVEMGYVTHPVEGAQLKDTNYLDRIAYGISYGVLEYLENSLDGI